MQEWVAFVVRRRRIIMLQDGRSFVGAPSYQPPNFVAYNPHHSLRTAPRALAVSIFSQWCPTPLLSPHFLFPPSASYHDHAFTRHFFYLHDSLPTCRYTSTCLTFSALPSHPFSYISLPSSISNTHRPTTHFLPFPKSHKIFLSTSSFY